ncbi:MAG: RluA family pseudouridine synthase [bacterium]|nr:RluA family pseudouridine synthase [bacterium]
MRVLYQDNHLLVVEKPPGMLSQSDTPDGDDDLLSRAKAYIKREFNKPGAVWLGLVHRLDREVGGVMIFARTSKAAARLSEEIRAGRTRKIYRAWLEGRPRLKAEDKSPAFPASASLQSPEAGGGRTQELDPHDWIRLTDRIAKDTKRRMAVPASADESGNKVASLRYRIVEAVLDAQRIPVEIELETGRFHQIRYQFSSRGAPILGDRKYGSRGSLPGVKLALYCVEMGIRHPIRGEFMSFTCDPPAAWSRNPA